MADPEPKAKATPPKGVVVVVAGKRTPDDQRSKRKSRWGLKPSGEQEEQQAQAEEAQVEAPSATEPATLQVS